MVERFEPPVSQASPETRLPKVGKTPAFSPLGSLQVEVKASRMGFLGLAPVFPARRYSQAEILAGLGYADNATAQAIFAGTSIETRHLSVPLEDLPFCDGQAQNKAFREALDTLAAQAAKTALLASGVDISQLGCLIVNATSGFHMPGLAAGLVSTLKLPANLVKYDLCGSGCLGALPTLSLADDYLKAHPDRKVLAICVDVGSLVLKPSEPDDKETMIVNSLFGDAAVGMVLGAGGAGPGWPEVVDFHYQQAPDSMGIVCATLDGESRVGARLRRELPEVASGIVATAVEALLERHQLSRNDISHWLFHPGGPAILNRIQAVFELPDEKMAHSRYVLKNYGNVSSPSCMLILEHLVRQQLPRAGEWAIIGAIGPGLTAGLALVKF